MTYTLTIKDGFVPGKIFNLAFVHKQVVIDLIVIQDDENNFEEVRIYFNSINPGLQAYFLRKIGAVQIDEYLYEV
ncbi:hypothetical protein PP427_gp170 [Salmonella phage KM16]|uniref:hypothetical protein n=1 Tax=Salmonella phage KM16 TaxID=2797303 RepID=UPI00249292B6|nr:hypothetical protein PP427_gp170 [Salmonella phage KM16]